MKLGLSPCPNDTFIFYKSLKDQIFSPYFADVEELNHLAITLAELPLSKVSFYTALKVEKNYDLLPCGGALGRGCGPILIHRKNARPIKKILIPGINTTAALLLQIYLKKEGMHDITLESMRYDQICPALLNGDADYGLIIHEERFTYQEKGLFSLVDLGSFWEKETGLPIPLGGILLRKDYSEKKNSVIASIRESIAFSKENSNDKELLSFIKTYSQSPDDAVISSHIDLYVNDFSIDTGKEGSEAIHLLRVRAKEAGLL